MSYNIKEEELDEIIGEITAELAPQLKKSEGIEKATAMPEDSDDESYGSAGPAEALPSEEAAPEAAEPAPEADAAPDQMATDPQDGMAQEAAPAEGEGQAIDPAPTAEALAAEYSQLSPDELQMHLQAAHMAAEQMGLFADEDQAPEQEQPAPEAAPAAPAPAPEGLAMSEKKEEGEALKKAEKNFEEKLKELEAKLAKSEADKAAQEEEINKLVDFLGKPMRKSLKEAVDEPANRPLTKQEISDKLNALAKSASTPNADRKLINKFALGHIGVNEVSHLLK